METDKRCGNCRYGDYKHKMYDAERVVCEVYSKDVSSRQKGCTNWKEERNGRH